MKSSMNLSLCVVVVCGAANAGRTSACPVDLSSACLDLIDARFRYLAKPDWEVSRLQMREIVDVCLVGDKMVWKKLRETLTNDILDHKIWNDSMRIACVIADEEIASDLIGIMLGWLAEAEKLARLTPPADRTWAGSLQKHAYRLSIVGNLAIDELGQLQAVMTDCEPAFTLTKAICAGEAMNIRRRFRWWDVLDACHGPKIQRQAFALSMLNVYGNLLHHPPVISLDDPKFREDLRELFQDTVRGRDNTDGLFAGVAATLAHLGDKEILNDLNALRRPFKDNPTMRMFLKHSIQKIEMQHPPKKILEYIASDEDPYVDVRVWAIERAVELGLPKSEIRDSILARAHHCKTLGRGRRPNIRPEMVHLRRLGISLGVLKAHDLPLEDVPPSRAVD